ncbi:hypothetical protein OE88DRAFT_1239549 [Heliocybe sulcata]|uniref:Uncharacterized protein n=1 Tax=Heliocybe sulcata TaxID=5364 RepID=A0A5C3NBC4_9AGAM|nr:hypothetical protein OE88DRAFT_1239549 [Heliocybe sulcata]
MPYVFLFMLVSVYNLAMWYSILAYLATAHGHLSRSSFTRLTVFRPPVQFPRRVFYLWSTQIGRLIRLLRCRFVVRTTPFSCHILWVASGRT